MKKSFVLYTDQIEMLECLSDDQRGRVMSAVYKYAANGELVELDQAEKIAFLAIKKTIDADCKKWEETRQARIEAGKKGGEAKASNATKNVANLANAKFAKKNISNVPVTVTVTDTVTVNNNNNAHARERFCSFWQAYPKKVGKGAAEKAFEKLHPSKELTDQMIRAVINQRSSDQWQKENGQYIPNPSTWLNQKRWEDDIAPPSGRFIQRQETEAEMIARVYDPLRDETEDS